MKTMHKRMTGVTLIEVLLVTVIISAVLYMSAGYMQQKIRQGRYDRTAGQVQQILDASLAYYLANGKWPTSVACLAGKTCPVAYLPNIQNTMNYPSMNYLIGSTPTKLTVVVFVYTGASSYADATTLAGMLPTGYTTDMNPAQPCLPTSLSCVVYATEPPPGQNTNNATAVNFSAVYHNGACVPVPACPPTGGTTMVPSIVVAPVGVTGANTAPTPNANCTSTDQSGCSVDAYPLNSFSASATPLATTDGSASGPTSGPYSCQTAYTATPQGAPCYLDTSTMIPVVAGQQYWRVCLSVVTEKGVVTPTTSAQGQLTGNVMAITRCIIPGENSGSGFTVWSQ